MANATAYLIIEPVWGTGSWGKDKIQSLRIARVVKHKPAKFHGVAVKLTLNIPDQAFKPLEPEVFIDVPEEALAYEPTVTVEFPEPEDAET